MSKIFRAFIIITLLTYIHLIFIQPLAGTSEPAGNLIINCKQQNVRIYLNDTEMKNTKIIGLLAGLYYLRIVKTGYETWEKRIRIRDDANLNVEINLTNLQDKMKYEPIKNNSNSGQNSSNKKRYSNVNSSHKITIMGEFGLGNVISVYGAYDLGLLGIGTGLGYYYYDDNDNGTSISVFEPAIMVMKEISMVVLRLRAGYDIVAEKRFGLSGYTIAISPDVMVQMKGIYAGISTPVIIGKEGTSLVFTIGAGYRYIFSF